MSNGSVSFEASEKGEVGVGKNFAGNNLVETVSTVTNENTKEVIEAVSGLYDKVQRDNPLVAQFLDALLGAFDDRGKTIEHLSQLTKEINANNNVIVQALRSDLSVLHKRHNELELALHAANASYDQAVGRERYNNKQILELQKTCVLSMRLKVFVSLCALFVAVEIGAFLVWVWWVR